MTVREYIERLSALEPDANIWIMYDGSLWFEPPQEERISNGHFDAIDKEHFKKIGVKESDYFIQIG